MSKTNSKVTAIVLAAGRSIRMGETNKLLTQLGDKTLLQHVISNIKQSKVTEIVVVTGYESEKISEHICDPSICCVRNDNYQKGLSTSIRSGIEEIESSADAVLIVQADMPFVEACIIDKLITTFAENMSIVVPRYKNQAGNPLLWPASYFGRLKQLSGDKGARKILAEYQNNISYLEVDNIGILVDIDDPKDLAFFQNRFDNNQE